MSLSISLNKFNPELISNVSGRFLIIGKRLIGKTTLARDIINNICKIKYRLKYDDITTTTNGIPRGTIISCDNNATKQFNNMIPNIKYYNKYDDNVINEYISTQSNIIQQKNKELKDHAEIKTNPKSILLIDEIPYNKTDMVFRQLLHNCQNYHTSLILTTQYSLPMSPDDRGSFQYIFIFSESVPENLNRLYNHFAGMFPDLETFTQTMNTYANGYNCLVIDNTSRSNKLEDKVFWYKAD